MTTGKAAPLPRRPLWWRLLVGVSFAMNLAVIGAVLGIALGGGPRGERPPPVRHDSLGALIALLPPDDRREIGDDLRRLGRETGMSRSDRAEHRRALNAAIAADPFDPEALLALLDAGQTRSAAFAERSHRILADELAQMDAGARAAYVERLERFDRFRHKDGKRHPERPASN